MNVLIVYDTYFGNTEKAAYAMGDALRDHGPVEVVRVRDLRDEDLDHVELLIVGSPTRAFAPTKPISRFLKELDGEKYSGMKIAVFDTRMNVEETNVKILKFMAKHKGYATDTMIAILKKRGFNVLAGYGEIFVAESEGPLKTGEIEKAAKWALNLLNT